MDFEDTLKRVFERYCEERGKELDEQMEHLKNKVTFSKEFEEKTKKLIKEHNSRPK